ncbi:MAG: YaiO family outer membrane beta-barrel protein [Burkholderiales bacterium]
MRTALAVGFAAGALCLQAATVFAAEGSSLRGLKPPRVSLDPGVSGGALVAGGAGFKLGSLDLAPALSSYGGFTFESQRLASPSIEFRSALYQPPGQNISALADAYSNPFYEALPRYTLSQQVSRSLGGGWGLGFGVRQNEYTYFTTNLLSFSAEHTWGNLRSGYTLYSSRADGSALGAAHRFQVSYAYGDRNSIGLAYTTGRDIENPALTLGLPLADVRDWSLSGRHWLSPNWALTYDVLSQEHAYLNRRQGLRLGVSRSF